MRHHGVCIPNNMASGKAFEDLDLSKDEVKRLGEALKDETFRKMLVEYAEEISDPENRRKAEEEIAMMENERGMNVQFIHPEPGYVMKTTVDGSKKAFINICQNDKIEKPKAKKQVGPDGKSGLMWQIPHSFAPPKDDHDKTSQPCKVFDVVFHPDTYRMAMTNERFKKLVEDTALEGIERQFGCTLDKKNVKYPKMKFKGFPTATVIRERVADAETKPHDPDDILSQMPYPYDNKTTAEKTKENEKKQDKKAANKSSTEKGKSNNDKYTEPKYTITHRSEVDMSEYRNAPDAKPSTRPKELVIKIELPLLKSAAQASLDIFEKKLVLESVLPAAYKLDLSLPFPVNEDEGSAKFDKSKKTLTVTLPVLPDKTPPMPFTEKTSLDSGDASANASEPNNSPLIEVLSNGVGGDNKLENGFDSDLPPEGGSGGLQSGDRKGQGVSVGTGNQASTKIKFPQNVKWILPEHQFSQDNETVSFVINVQSVEEKSVSTSFPQESAAMIQFMSIGAGCFPVYYSLYVEFPDSCGISPEHCNVDVSDENLVFIILKNKKCRGLWDSFRIGIDATQLEKKQFLTESNLQRELSDLDKEASEEAEMPVQVDMTPQLSVVEMNEKRLTIDIKPPKGKKKKSEDKENEDEDEEYDPPSSAEIEVVHRHPPPDLHSILKQRTMSESSEDLINGEIDSPRSDGEELSSSFSKKRSVSFSSHVDQASFRTTASVSSMTPALKSKRRRQRKREERRKGRTRHNSEGTSSGDDCQLSVSDSLSHSEEEVDKADGATHGKRAMLQRAVSDPGPCSGGLSTIVDDEEEKGSGEPGKKKNKKNSKKTKNCGSKPQPDGVLDFRTKGESGDQAVVENCVNESDSVISGKNAGMKMDGAGEGGTDVQDVVKEEQSKSHSDKNKKIVSEIKSKLAEGKNGTTKDVKEEDSDDDDFVDAVSSMADEFSTKVGFDKSCGNSGSNEKMETSDKSEGQSAVNDTQKKNGEIVNDEKVHEKSDVETDLRWDDGQINGGEHVTQCAFEFTNSVMFDLDVD